MSESGDSDVQTGDTHGQQGSTTNNGALLSVHVDNMEVSQADDNEDDEPEPGDQENNRRQRNKRVDSTMYEQANMNGNVLIDGVLHDDTVRRRKHVPGPRRTNTAPVTNQEVNMRQSIAPTPASRVQGVPVARQNRNIKIEHVAVCGICGGDSMDDMWLRGGSLQMMDPSENIIVEKASRLEYLCGIQYLLTFIIVTNRRFVVKQLWKYCGCNVQTEEESHHFSNLQHVKVERGLGMRQIQQSLLIFVVLQVLSALPLGSGVLVQIFQYFLATIATLYGAYNLLLFLYYYNVNFLVVDVAKNNVVGSWTLTPGPLNRGRSYLTIRAPLIVDACFGVMNELMKRHPSLLPVEADI